MKLSIIVPVYNVELYIVKCLSSLLEQDIEDYEIIVVNDGTKDRSMELVHQNFSNCTRIHIIEQENQGLSAARNIGMKHASGDYVWFFDSDDWVSENILASITQMLKGCDILYFTRSYEEKSDGKSQERVETVCYCTNGRELSLRDYPHCAPFYIYRREFLFQNNLSFEKGIFHEDSLFTPCALYMAKEVCPYDIPVYHRLLREDSITHTRNPKRCHDLCFVINKLMAYGSAYVVDSDRYAWGNCIADATNELLYLTCTSDNELLVSQITNFVNGNYELISYICHSRKRNSRILGNLAMFYKGNIFIIYRFLFRFRYRNR